MGELSSADEKFILWSVSVQSVLARCGGAQFCEREAYFICLARVGPGPRIASDGARRVSQRRTTCFMLRNSASGPEFGLPGRILAGLLPGNQ